ncbi:MAG: phosphopyruvate hydratase [Clostridia bacterium]|nr:phosphopyruvate hydratase [Clostridia bacterium]
MVKIESVKAREILDSRANPTVEAEVVLSDGSVGCAAVPSGASTGKGEAHELRDVHKRRYRKLGVLDAVRSVNERISAALMGEDAYDLEKADSIMIALDGTYNKSNLGANAILSVSMALARAGAASLNMPLYRYVGGIFASRMPVPMMNILNGGVHAANNLDIQEFMILPVGAESFLEAVRFGSEIYHSLRSILISRSLSVGVGDEGGFAPNLNSEEEAIELIIEAIEEAGYTVGRDVFVGLDVASSEWHNGTGYRLNKTGREMTSDEMCEYVASLVEKYPIISVEDGAAEEDFYGWEKLTARLCGNKTLLVGDDLFVTDHKKISEYAARKIANTVLIKPNQIGTLSETARAISVAKSLGYRTIMSHRSGETEDSIIADLAVGFGCEFVKMGAPARSERVAKYNRLMKIESEIKNACYVGIGLV